MKKKILFVMGFLMFMFIAMPNVDAATTITQADFDAAKTGTPTNGVSYTEASGYKWYSLTADEEFTFGSDLDLGDAFLDSDNNTINLNGHSITNSISGDNTVINAYDRDLTLTGTGTIEKDIFVSGGALTLNGNITYNGTVYTSDGTGLGAATINAGTFNAGFEGADSIITINNGTFKGAGWSGALYLSGVTATIKGGTFSATAASAAYLDGSTVTITGGTFTSTGDNGIETFDDATNLTISGGTFTGLASGLTTNDSPTIKLSGGTFKATGTGTDKGAIRSDKNFADFLASGYKYSVSSTTTTGVYSVMETSVVSASTSTTTATSVSSSATNNPATGDNVLFYTLMLGLSIIGFAGLYTRKKKIN